MDSRLSIEKAILSAAIYYNGYPQVAHILTPHNFTSNHLVHNREIFQVITNLFPKKPIDLITVSAELRAYYPDRTDLLNELYGMPMSFIVHADNIIYWSMLLLQIDIAEKFKDQMIVWRDARIRDMDHVEAGALTEMLEVMANEVDVFEMIDKSVEYFGITKMNLEKDEAEKFYKKISVKVSKIKQVESLNLVLKNLFIISGCTSSQVKVECQAFARAIADMITSDLTNPRYTEAVNLMYQA